MSDKMYQVQILGFHDRATFHVSDMDLGEIDALTKHKVKQLTYQVVEILVIIWVIWIILILRFIPDNFWFVGA